MTDQTRHKFRPSASPLLEQLGSPGVGYFIPIFQREYSWEEEDVNRLIEDICDAVGKTTDNPDHVFFIGNLILLECSPVEGLHTDRQKLVSNVHTVIDGQQRLTTIAMLAAISQEKVQSLRKKIGNHPQASIIPQSFQDDLEALVENLSYLYSFQAGLRNHAEPIRKPLIIRAESSTERGSDHSRDQWTCAGEIDSYYRSDIAKFLGYRIAAYDADSEPTEFEPRNSLFKKNAVAIKRWIDKISSLDTPLPEPKSLNCEPYLDQQLDLLEIARETDRELQETIDAAIRLNAFSHVLLNRTWVTSFNCFDETLAFDMFQSLNSTGQPLSAIEVFKPFVVQKLGPRRFQESAVGVHFNEISKVFDDVEEASKKQQITDRLLLQASLCFDGKEIGKKFSDQKKWLESTYNECNSAVEKELMTQWLAEYSAYWKEIGSKGITIPRNSRTFAVKTHLLNCGLDEEQSDLAALCIYVLKKSKHDLANTVLSIFYSKLVRRPTDDGTSPTADFLSACKATLAFFFLYVVGTSKQPDGLYRKLFQAPNANMSIKNGEANQKAVFLKNYFREALREESIFDTNKSHAKELWKAKAIINLTFDREGISKFALLLAAHDRVPDEDDGNEGLTIQGRDGISPHLTCDRWFSADLAEREHIANKTKPTDPLDFPQWFDADLYPRETDIVNRIGNLALWPRQPNASVGDEWPHKALYYALVTQPTPGTPSDIETLKSKFGIETVPPAAANISANTNYIDNLAPIALRGLRGKGWTKDFVLKRTEQICEIVFDHLWEWLR